MGCRSKLKGDEYHCTTLGRVLYTIRFCLHKFAYLLWFCPGAEIRTVVPGVATAIASDNLGAQLSFMVLELCSYNLTVKQVSSLKVLKTLDLGEPPVAFEESDIVL